MTTYILSKPELISSKLDEIKELVGRANGDILLQIDFPTNTEMVDLYDLIGDPNEWFTDPILEILTSTGILIKLPVLSYVGKQVTIKVGKDKKEEPVWMYEWGEESFSVLSTEQLTEVGWELRYHPGFTHITALFEE